MVHGDAFVRTLPDKWERLPANQVVVKTSIDKEGTLVEDTFEFSSGTGTVTLTPKEVIHFKNRDFISFYEAPYGHSLMEDCLTALHNLRIVRKLGSSEGLQVFENEILKGLQIPKFVLDRNPSLDPTIAKFSVGLVVDHVNETEELLCEGFNIAINRHTKAAESPTIRLHPVTEERILRDVGFDFSKEIATLKSLRSSGIISDEAFREMAKIPIA